MYILPRMDQKHPDCQSFLVAGEHYQPFWEAGAHYPIFWEVVWVYRVGSILVGMGLAKVWILEYT